MDVNLYFIFTYTLLVVDRPAGHPANTDICTDYSCQLILAIAAAAAVVYCPVLMSLCVCFLVCCIDVHCHTTGSSLMTAAVYDDPCSYKFLCNTLIQFSHLFVVHVSHALADLELFFRGRGAKPLVITQSSDLCPQKP